MWYVSYISIKLSKNLVSNSDFFGFKVSVHLAKTGEILGSETQLGRAQGFLERHVPERIQMLKNWLGHAQRTLQVESVFPGQTWDNSRIKS